MRRTVAAACPHNIWQQLRDLPWSVERLMSCMARWIRRILTGIKNLFHRMILQNRACISATPSRRSSPAVCMPERA